MSLKAFDLRDCAVHGHSLFRSSRCIHCEREGIPAPKPTPLKEPIPAWFRRVICGIDARKANNEIKRKAHNGRPPSKTLTVSEQRVVNAMAAGYTTHGQIARVTGLHKRSISRSIENALNRTGCDHVKDLVRFANSEKRWFTPIGGGT